MNDTEVTMQQTGSQHGLQAYARGLEAAGMALALARRVPAPFRSLADQLIRAASSVPANLSEGHGRSGRDRLQLWRVSYASAKEVDAHLQLLLNAGAVDRKRARQAIALFDQVRAMTWRLLHPRT